MPCRERDLVLHPLSQRELGRTDAGHASRQQRTRVRGDRVPDFSHCGYAGGDRPVPDAPVRVVVAPQPGDSTARIQRAIDYVSGLAEDTNGLRGAVLLLKGRHEISGSLRIRASGVVLRGQGMDENGTVLVATGLDRRVLIEIAGRNERTNHAGQAWLS